MVNMGREAVSLFLHAVLLGVFTLVFHALIGDPEWTPAALAAFLLAYPIRYAAAARLHRSSPAFSRHGWMCADLLFFGLMGWKFGVIESGGIVLAGLILMPAALCVSPLIMARFNACTIFLYALLQNQQGVPLDSPGLWSSDIPCLLIFAAMSMMVSVYRMRSHAARSAFRKVAADVFEQLHLNLAVLDREGRFVLANSRAVKTLKQGRKDLVDMKFSDLVSKSPGPADELRREGALSGMLTRKDGSLCPVAYEMVPMNLHGSMFGREDSNELFEYQLVVFTDICDLVAGQEALSRQERNQAVNNMLEVFADGLRNPLAGISAYVQVLLRIEEKKSAGEESEQMKIYRQMVADIEDLDSLLEDLMADIRLTPEEVEGHFVNLKFRRQKGVAEGLRNRCVCVDF